MKHRLNATPGTYALVLALQEPCDLQIGRIGRIRFDSPYYLYFGSAFGPGGLAARIRHHSVLARRPHWHIDFLRKAANIVDVWYSTDEARLECIWASSALAHRNVSPVLEFGASDCRCLSHLLAAKWRPNLTSFRRRLDDVRSDCRRIHRLHVNGDIAA